MTKKPERYFSAVSEEYAETYSIDNMPPEFIAILDRFIDKVGKGRILDAGCGFGKDTEYFQENRLEAVGIDLAQGMIDYAQKNGNAEYHLMDVRDIGFDDESFDGAWCNTVMQFFPPDKMEEVLEQLYRVLKPDGVLYTTFKQGEGTTVREKDEFSEEDNLERHRITEKKARKLLEKHGFEIQEMEKTRLNDMTVMNIFCRKN